MKTSHECPKCSSHDILIVKGSTMNDKSRIALGKWGNKRVSLDRYICYICGFTEEYVQIDTSFKKIGKKILDNQEDPNNTEFV